MLSEYLGLVVFCSYEQVRCTMDPERMCVTVSTAGCYKSSATFQMAISPPGVVRSTSCLVPRWVFGVGGSNSAIFGFIQDGGSAAILENSMAISPRRIIRFTPCLVLGWGFRDRRIEWR